VVPKVNIWSTLLGAKVSSRHRYAAYVAFEVVLGWDFQWCSESVFQEEIADIQIQYGGLKPEVTSGVIWIPDAGLLNQAGVDTSDFIWSMPSFTPGQVRLPFGVKVEHEEHIESDWLSWVFWMASRMEEFAPHPIHSRDEMGRFKGTASLAHQEGWLEFPMVEKCVRDWAQQKAPACPLPVGYVVQPTIDVDSAFAYRHKGFKLTLGASINDVIQGRWARFFERPAVLLGWKDDPYDTYAWLEAAHARLRVRATYFFLLANRGEYDRGVPWSAPELQAQMRALMKTADIGIHPGVSAHEANSDAVMKEEVRRLAVIQEGGVERGRQHYLLQRNPASWRRMERLGILADHSLGYADVPGFRGGLSRPFRAYDLKEERIMSLVLHPIAVMDATLMRHLKLTPQEALQVVRQLSFNVREVEGVMTLLWHNESVSDRWEWRGWKTFYQEVLAAVVLDKNGITLES
tara:strand:- start:1035 stop:2417 length:1383 start_codon:yes stop_codon:yes gene_type:complete